VAGASTPMTSVGDERGVGQDTGVVVVGWARLRSALMRPTSGCTGAGAAEVRRCIQRRCAGPVNLGVGRLAPVTEDGFARPTNRYDWHVGYASKIVATCGIG